MTLEDIQKQAADFVASAKVIAADGLTWAEFGQMFVALIALLVRALDAVSSMTGEQKHAAVIAAVGSLFDAVADLCVPAVALPIWFLARPAVRSLVLALASGAIEHILVMVRPT
jgi:hypothetical protein